VGERGSCCDVSTSWGERFLLRCLNELGSGTTDDVSLIPLVMSIVLRMIRIEMGEMLIKGLFPFFPWLLGLAGFFFFVFGGHFGVNKVLPFFFTLFLFGSGSCSLVFFSVFLHLVRRVSAFFWGGFQVASSYLHGYCYHFYFYFHHANETQVDTYLLLQKHRGGRED